MERRGRGEQGGRQGGEGDGAGQEGRRLAVEGDARMGGSGGGRG